METKPRLQGLQGLRAVAALLVVWVHTIPAHLLAPVSTPRVYWQDFGSCGVDIFLSSADSSYRWRRHGPARRNTFWRNG